ncbi:MAG: extracellular solute-binding protein [Calditrichaeota bacterium]|nr:MAG: extracellular solute-binding protein [Calditrichota bacterium]
MYSFIKLVTLISFFSIINLACFSSYESSDDGQLIYWTAPNVEVSEFDRTMVHMWNTTHPQNKIKWEIIPAGTTSEEVLLTAIATGRGPDISTNIFAGFAAQLAEADAIVALDTLPGFWQLLEKRKMTSIVKKNWMFKGHVYVLPIYISPQLMWYNKRILNELEVNRLPKTYGEFIKLSKKARKHNYYGLWVDVSAVWWKRWFDFITLYSAASGGQSYLDLQNKKTFLESEAGRAVTKFFYDIFTLGLSPRFEIKDGFEKGQFLASIMDAARIVRAKKLYPDLEYVISPLIVPDSYPQDAPVYTFAEQKGMVIFSYSKKRKRAWEFMKWFFSDEHDLLWMEITHYLPARDDLLTNPSFKLYFEKNSTMKLFAESIRYAAPLVLSPQTVQIQTLLNRELWQPIVFGAKTPIQAVRDANKSISQLLHSGT